MKASATALNVPASLRFFLSSGLMPACASAISYRPLPCVSKRQCRVLRLKGDALGHTLDPRIDEERLGARRANSDRKSGQERVPVSTGSEPGFRPNRPLSVSFCFGITKPQD